MRDIDYKAFEVKWSRIRTLMRALALRIRSQNTTLSLLLGDLNFVADAKDRWSSARESWAQNGDSRDAEVMRDHILRPFGFAEFLQEQMTRLCACQPETKSKL